MTERLSEVFAVVQRQLSLPRTRLFSLFRERLLEVSRDTFEEWRKSVAVDSTAKSFAEDITKRADMMTAWTRTLRPFLRLADRLGMADSDVEYFAVVDSVRDLRKLFVDTLLVPHAGSIEAAIATLVDTLHFADGDGDTDMVSATASEVNGSSNIMNVVTELFHSVLSVSSELFDVSFAEQFIDKHYAQFVMRSTALQVFSTDNIVTFLDRVVRVLQYESTLCFDLLLPLCFTDMARSRALVRRMETIISTFVVNVLRTNASLHDSLRGLVVAKRVDDFVLLTASLARLDHFGSDLSFFWQETFAAALERALTEDYASRPSGDAEVQLQWSASLLSTYRTFVEASRKRHGCQPWLMQLARQVDAQFASTVVANLHSAHTLHLASVVHTRMVSSTFNAKSLDVEPVLALIKLLSNDQQHNFCLSLKRLVAQRLVECSTVAECLQVDKAIVALSGAVSHPSDVFATMRSMAADTSKSIQTSFASRSTLSAVMDVRFVTTRWPLAESVQSTRLVLPATMQHLANQFLHVLNAQPNATPSRQLHYIAGAGTVVLDASFGGSVYTLQLSTLQACVLLLFEDRAKWTLGELATALGDSVSTPLVKNVIRSLRAGSETVTSLVCPKTDGSLVRNDKFSMPSLNIDFTIHHKNPSMWNTSQPTPNSPSPSSSSSVTSPSSEKSILTDRESLKYAVQAMLLRIMKKSSSMPFTLLLRECSAEFLAKYGVSLDSRVIKESIDKSISSEYFERSTVAGSDGAVVVVLSYVA